MSVTRLLIRCDGTTEALAGAVSIDEACRLIGAHTLDAVALRHMGEPLHVMCVDDDGYETQAVPIPQGVFLKPVRARKPLNPTATDLYHLNCPPGTTHQIVGDVLILPDEDFA
jgi:hypothetical protein